MKTLPFKNKKNDKEQNTKNKLIKLKTKVAIEEKNKISIFFLNFNEEKNLVNKFEFEKTIFKRY